MHRLFAPGSNKKIVILDAPTTVKYLIAQLLDFQHDAPNNIQPAYNDLVKLIAVWIHTNNYALRNWDINAFVAMMGKLLSATPYKIRDLVNNAGGLDQLFADNMFTIADIDTDISAIIDQCGCDIAAIVCSNKGKFATITPAIVYDQGAFAICGERQVKTDGPSFKLQNDQLDLSRIQDGSWRIPYFSQNVFNNYSFDEKVIRMCSAVSPYSCDKLRLTGMSSVFDHCLAGYLPDPTGKLQRVILAYRGTTQVNYFNKSTNTNESYLSFSGKINDQIAPIRRGYSPSPDMLYKLHINLKTLCNSGNNIDLLLAYNELMAKHWGDLGLILDAIGTNMYVVSNDNTIKYLSAVLQSNCIYDNKMRTAPQKINTEIKYETNTSSIFNRSYNW